MPHEYKFMNDHKGKFELGESLWYEYFIVMYTMYMDLEVPSVWMEYASAHQEDLTIMAADWEWQTCLSEVLISFSLI